MGVGCSTPARFRALLPELLLIALPLVFEVNVEVSVSVCVTEPPLPLLLQLAVTSVFILDPPAGAAGAVEAMLGGDLPPDTIMGIEGCCCDWVAGGVPAPPAWLGVKPAEAGVEAGCEAACGTADAAEDMAWLLSMSASKSMMRLPTST